MRRASRTLSVLLLAPALLLSPLVFPGGAADAVTQPMASDPAPHLRVREVLSDLAPPLTSLSTSPMTPNGDAGWFKGAAPTVTATAVDAEGSEPATIYYDWGVDPPTGIYASTHAAPVGENILFYRSVDSIGNTEAVRSRLFKVDPTVSPPVVSAPVGFDVAPTTVRGTVHFDAAAADAVSGVGYVVFYYFGWKKGAWNPVGTQIGAQQASPVGGANVSGESADGGIYRVSWDTLLVPDGDYKLEAQVRDVAGNIAFSAPQFVRVDNWFPSPARSKPPRD